jgi:hypothetical protein
MANTRLQEQQNARQHQQQSNRATNEAAKNSSRIARTSMEGSVAAAQASTDMLQRNAQTAHQMWESSTKMAAQLMEQSMQEFGRAFGIANEGAQQQPLHSMQSVIQSGTILASGMQSVSRELFDLARQRLEQNLGRADSFLRCQTPQELMQAYTEFVHENLQGFVQSTRRIAEISVQVSDEAARRMRDANFPR